MKKSTLIFIRIMLPLACFIISYINGHSVGKSIWHIFITAILTCFLTAMIPLVFYPILSLYGLRIESKDEDLLDFNKPVNRVNLSISIFCLLLLTLIIARKF